MMLDNLYYNCGRPVEVLEAKQIRCSDIFTGVSMSSWSELGSHGPFKITFRKSVWFDQFIQCQYPKTMLEREVLYDKIEEEFDILPQHFHRIIKAGGMFKDEQEWYSPEPVKFTYEDVIAVTFMTNAPSIRPRITSKARKILLDRTRNGKYPFLYQERMVNDTYLSVYR